MEETLRKLKELTKDLEESEIIYKNTEDLRKIAEDSRVKNESIRKEIEEVRVIAEDARNKAEDARIIAEENRKRAEILRQEIFKRLYESSGP